MGKTARGSRSSRASGDPAMALLLFPSGIAMAPLPSREQNRTYADTRKVRRLAAQAEAVDDLLVAGVLGLLEIVEKAAPLRDHLEQAAAGVVVLDVALEVFSQVGDPFGQDRDLHLRRAG